MEEYTRESGLPAGLASVLTCVASVVSEVSNVLRSGSVSSGYSGGTNAFGDNQLEVDVAVDRLIFERLASCSAVQGAASEEQPELKPLPGRGYTVVFDPLDGSSIMGANFAVGTIFGIWPGGSPVGRAGRRQAAAAYAVYGPQTILVWARPKAGSTAAAEVAAAEERVQAGAEAEPGPAEHVEANGEASADGRGSGPDAEARGSDAASLCSCSARLRDTHQVDEFLLNADGTWRLNRADLAVAPVSKIFAPANLRAAAANEEYAELVRKWIEANFTLRYTGGMVPDVHHILAKGSGVFCNPCSSTAPAKLRLVFECAPLSFVLEAAGGSSTTGQHSVLDEPIRTTNDRSKICLGSSQLVEESLPAMQAA
ncbi:hypothetical protein HYH03_007579 [Edaphochlamys debaryana]|uniref:Fructose-bisphosphatase n=1 Tax=Edaphochlamys debaryana TaxID=47281 RepID=A0A835Y1J8_9CHLO|nr:hypothetical protein HYH03_007579 [Edaphochlamys debaryana]|eukprot:KAG2494223.1 hypothetical protein HYH03_007579 [Edaphochlamys debaryana]